MLRLTPSGARRFPGILLRHLQRFAVAFEGVGAEELEGFRTAIARMERVMDRLAGPDEEG